MADAPRKPRGSTNEARSWRIPERRPLDNFDRSGCSLIENVEIAVMSSCSSGARRRAGLPGSGLRKFYLRSETRQLRGVRD